MSHYLIKSHIQHLAKWEERLLDMREKSTTQALADKIDKLLAFINRRIDYWMKEAEK